MRWWGAKPYSFRAVRTGGGCVFRKIKSSYKRVFSPNSLIGICNCQILLGKVEGANPKEAGRAKNSDGR